MHWAGWELLLWAMGSQGRLRIHPNAVVHRVDQNRGSGRWFLGSTKKAVAGSGHWLRQTEVPGGPRSLGMVLVSFWPGSPEPVIPAGHSAASGGGGGELRPHTGNWPAVSHRLSGVEPQG